MQWHLTTYRVLSLWDRLRVLVGVPVFARFVSPDGNCHAACSITVTVQRDWPPDPPVT
jgi:hypothetical protein